LKDLINQEIKTKVLVQV